MDTHRKNNEISRLNEWRDERLCSDRLLARGRVVFQLAGGSRDHYTSRAKFILFDTAKSAFLMPFGR